MKKRIYATRKGTFYYVVGKTLDGREIIKNSGNYYAILGFSKNMINYAFRNNKIIWFEVDTKKSLGGDGELEAILEKEPREGLRIVGLFIDKTGESNCPRGHDTYGIVTSVIREIIEE